jgi:hypothetical protein
MSTLQGVLVFVGIPLLAIVVISLLVMAPSLAKGPRYRPGQQWDAQPEHFGALPVGSSGSAGQLEAGHEAAGREQATGGPRDRRGTAEDGTTGGASVTW